MREAIAQFLDSWGIFSHTYISGWLIAVALSQIGCLVVARNQAFLGAAVAQASAGGVALAIWASSALSIAWLSSAEGETDHPVHTAAAILVACVASFTGTAVRLEIRQFQQTYGFYRIISS